MRRQFDDAVEGLLQAVRNAANPTYPAWQAYYGDAVRVAVWQARHVAHKARVLGLLANERKAEAA